MAMSIHELFLRFHSLFGDMHILELKSSFLSNFCNFACTFDKMVEHISGNTYHITDIGNVNNITVAYWEHLYNVFYTLKNKPCSLFSSMLSSRLLLYLRNYKLDSVMFKFFFFL